MGSLAEESVVRIHNQRSVRKHPTRRVRHAPRLGSSAHQMRADPSRHHRISRHRSEIDTGSHASGTTTFAPNAPDESTVRFCALTTRTDDITRRAAQTNHVLLHPTSREATYPDVVHFHSDHSYILPCTHPEYRRPWMPETSLQARLMLS